VTRRGRRGDDAQAVLETALILPILLFLVCNFIGVMVQVTVQQQLNAATALAAQSRFQAPNNAVDASGTRCCGTGETQLSTAGLPTGCRYAAETFYAPHGAGSVTLLES
jgi:Flp pilus assembly protein TadG